nr:MAG TPA: hypothetical protein [Caudoviricetes sp.]
MAPLGASNPFMIPLFFLNVILNRNLWVEGKSLIPMKKGGF